MPSLLHLKLKSDWLLAQEVVGPSVGEGENPHPPLRHLRHDAISRPILELTGNEHISQDRKDKRPNRVWKEYDE